MCPYYPQGNGASSVLSVNGHVGVVVLDPDDIGSPWNQVGSIYDAITDKYPQASNAMNAANANPASDPTDDPQYQSGLLVRMPAGAFDPSVTITKEVNISGVGGWATSQNQLGVAPQDDTVCPQNVTIKNLFINTVFIGNETQGGGVFNPNMGLWAIRFEDCIIFGGGDTIKNINNIEFKNCEIYGDLNFLNCPTINIIGGINQANILSTFDDTQPNPPVGFQAGANGLILDGCTTNGVQLVTIGAVPNILTSLGSGIGNLQLGADCQYYVDGGYITSATIDPAAGNLYYRCDAPYTVADATKWADPPPNKIDDAIDRIAAVVGASTPIP